MVIRLQPGERSRARGSATTRPAQNEAIQPSTSRRDHGTSRVRVGKTDTHLCGMRLGVETPDAGSTPADRPNRRSRARARPRLASRERFRRGRLFRAVSAEPPRFRSNKKKRNLRASRSRPRVPLLLLPRARLRARRLTLPRALRRLRVLILPVLERLVLRHHLVEPLVAVLAFRRRRRPPRRLRPRRRLLRRLGDGRRPRLGFGRRLARRGRGRGRRRLTLRSLVSRRFGRVAIDTLLVGSAAGRSPRRRPGGAAATFPRPRRRRR